MQGNPMEMHSALEYLAKASYLLAAILFILGIKRMASPVTARRGIVQAGIGMVIATLATFAITRGHNIGWIIAGLAIGVLPTWLWGRKVAMTDMPQMVALFNGMGGGSAAAIGAGELLKFGQAGIAPPMAVLVLAVVGALIGSVSMTGSIIAWAKLDGRMDRRFTFPAQKLVNLLVFAAAILAGLGSSSGTCTR
jgi:NAD(P) transhydrogenase subunit beta